jgi:hypothetical protein
MHRYIVAAGAELGEIATVQTCTMHRVLSLVTL